MYETSPSSVPMYTSPVSLSIAIEVMQLEGNGLLDFVKFKSCSVPFSESKNIPEFAVPIHFLLPPSTAIQFMVSELNRYPTSPSISILMREIVFLSLNTREGEE